MLSRKLQYGKIDPGSAKPLAKQYQLLEDKLFSLYEFEQESNPTRSQLLRQAYIQSQEKITARQMMAIVDKLKKSQLKSAVIEQEEVLSELRQLLVLLQSEDRGQRVRDELQRHQQYLRDVERLLRLQKGIRGQTDGGIDVERLARSEEKAADRAARLAEEIQNNEASPISNSDETKGADPQSGNPSNQQGEAPGSEGNPGSSEPPGNQAEPTGPASEPATPPPVQNRIRTAEEKMRQAQQQLDQAKRNDAAEAMRDAEFELEKAKQELEQILRQLREEEVERTLAKLESRFRQMLERQVRVYEATQKLNQVPSDQRNPSFGIQTGKLATEQSSIASDASRALLLLQEDGSSVAFPATVQDVHADMSQVASRLAASQVGQITIEIEEDIIDALGYIVKALVQSQQDLERMKIGQPSPKGQPGDQPLVDQLAEIKMLRGLQERIHKRHQRYSQMIQDPDDQVGQTNRPDIRAALDRLADRQSRLVDLVQDIVDGKNP